MKTITGKHYMKRILPLLLLITIAQLGFAQQKKKPLQDTLIWKKDIVITPSDFKGKKLNGPPANAYTTLLLYTKDEKSAQMLYVEAVFLRSKSFLNDKSSITLQHERLHFDITELFARKLRQRIIQKDFTKVTTDIGEEIKKMYDQINSEWAKENELYDKEVSSGQNVVKQKEWEQKIASQLAALEQYSNKGIDIFE
jgi:hypothetical protein